MQARVRLYNAAIALDVGCGEGRFCRMMQNFGTDSTGIDPTEALLQAARRADPAGKYVNGTAENLPFSAQKFDLVVAYLSLIDIADMDAAIAEMVRVLRPGGHILVANLQSYYTGFDLPTLEKNRPDGSVRATMRDYFTERAHENSWSNISVLNHHRPLERYMDTFLSHSLRLSHFAEPRAVGGEPARRRRYNNAPWFLIMEWRKPAEGASRARQEA